MTIPIFFSVDNNYAPYLSTALTSLAENTYSKYNYKVIVLYRKDLLCKSNMDKLIMNMPDHIIIEFVDMDERIETISDRLENRLRCEYFTPTIFYRL